MTDWIALQAHAVDLYDHVLPMVTDWDAPTPCSQWTAREVLAHVVDEQLWVPGLLAGGTVEEVAGDLEDAFRRLAEATGPDLVAYWHTLRAPVAAAWRGTPPDDEVHLSYGRAPVVHYLAQQTFDLAVHAWDVSVSQGVDLPWGDELDRAVLDFVRADLTDDPAPELFSAPLPGFDGGEAPARHAALARTGRDPSAWPAP